MLQRCDFPLKQGPAATNVPEGVYGVIDLYGQAAQATLIDLVSDYRSPMAEQAAAVISANLAGSAVGAGGAAEASEATSATLYSQVGLRNPPIIVSGHSGSYIIISWN